MAIAQITEKCTAHSKRTGKQCGKPSIPGGRVCRWHGGNAPQVRDAARRRLLELVDPAICTLERALILPGDEREPTAVNIAAARDILDRAGLVQEQDVEVEASGIRVTIRSVLDRPGE
jgi:hypothetical protein